MASWDRYGEEKKYRKDVDINDNPKHVGEPLRKLTLEDRLEIRRQTREQQKKGKRVRTAEINEDLESDDVDLSTVTSPSKRPKVTSGTGTDDGELDIIGVASSNGKRNEVVDLAEEEGAASRAAAIRRARRRAKAKAKAKGGRHPTTAGSPAPVANGDDVEVLE